LLDPVSAASGSADGPICPQVGTDPVNLRGEVQFKTSNRWLAGSRAPQQNSTALTTKSAALQSNWWSLTWVEADIET
jgi:hypothetical protein